MGYLPALGRPLPTYTGPPWRAAEPEEPVTPADLAHFHAAYPEATCSPRCAALLAALMRDWAR